MRPTAGELLIMALEGAALMGAFIFTVFATIHFLDWRADRRRRKAIADANNVIFFEQIQGFYDGI